MKTKNKKILNAFIAWAMVVSFGTQSIAQTTSRIGADRLQVGNSTSDSKSVIFNRNLGAANPGIRADQTSGQLEFSNDGTNWLAIGAGSGGAGGINLIFPNADFESGIGGTWAQSEGGTVVARTNTDALNGKGSFRFTPTGAAQTFRSGLFVISEALAGNACLAAFRYSTAEGTDKYKLRVLNDTDDEIAAIELDATTKAEWAYLPFGCGEKGDEMRWELISAGAAPVFIDGDDAHLGSDNRIGNQGGKAVGELFPMGFDGCPVGSVVADGTAVNRVGKYGELFAKISTAWGVGDGSTTFNLPNGEGVVLRGTGSQTISGRSKAGPSVGAQQEDQIQGHNHNTALRGPTPTGSSSAWSPSVVTTSANAIIEADTMVTNGSNGTPRVGSETRTSSRGVRYCVQYQGSETTLRVDQLGWRVNASISGGNPALGGSTVSSFTELTNGSLTLTNQPGRGVINAKVACSSTNAPTGTTCSVGNESLGVVFDLPAAGDVWACAQFSHEAKGDQEADIWEAGFKLVETPISAQTILQEGSTTGLSGVDVSAGSSNGGIYPHTICDTFSFASSGQKALRLMYKQNVTNSPGTNVVRADNASNSNPNVRFTVMPLSYLSGAMPIFKGMITNNDTVIDNGAGEQLSFSKGTYTPSTTNTTNVASSSSSISKWERIGNRVTVFARVNIDPTSGGGAATELRISLPITPTAFAASTDAIGNGVAQGGSDPAGGGVEALVGGTVVRYLFNAQNSNDLAHYLVFSYDLN